MASAPSTSSARCLTMKTRSALLPGLYARAAASTSTSSTSRRNSCGNTWQSLGGREHSPMPASARMPRVTGQSLVTKRRRLRISLGLHVPSSARSMARRAMCGLSALCTDSACLPPSATASACVKAHLVPRAERSSTAPSQFQQRSPIHFACDALRSFFLRIWMFFLRSLSTLRWSDNTREYSARRCFASGESRDAQLSVPASGAKKAK